MLGTAAEVGVDGDQFRVRLFAPGNPTWIGPDRGSRRTGAGRESATASATWLGNRTARHLDDDADGDVLARYLANAGRTAGQLGLATRRLAYLRIILFRGCAGLP